jgi:hypothetical protein
LMYSNLGVRRGKMLRWRLLRRIAMTTPQGDLWHAAHGARGARMSVVTERLSVDIGRLSVDVTEHDARQSLGRF